MAGKKAEKMGEDWTSEIEIPETWVEEQVGFDPYWTPEIGKSFRAMVVDIDDHDRDFVRYRLQNMAEAPLTCQRGPAADAEIIEVMPGDHFSCSVYATLPLKDFFGVEVMVVVYENRKLPANEDSEGRPRDCWMFKVLVSPETKKELAEARRNHALQLREAAKQSRIDASRISTSSNGKNTRKAMPAATSET